MRIFWPPGEAAQADYEALRAGELAGTPLVSPSALRFTKGGLAALVARPMSEPVYSGLLIAGKRPPWTPHADPRLEVLVASYQLLLDVLASEVDVPSEEVAE